MTKNEFIDIWIKTLYSDDHGEVDEFTYNSEKDLVNKAFAAFVFPIIIEEESDD